MSQTVELRCRCGAVEGRVEKAARGTVNRVVCYCDDCQAFVHHLKRADLLDASGGSDIIQVAPSSVTYVRGAERIVAVRLKPKGLYRWYASCCNTPLGNTLTPGIPFVGILAQTFRSPPDDAVGPPVGRIFGKFATGTAPPGSTRPGVGMLARTLRKVLGWKLGRRTWPHPFFDRDTRAPRYPVTVLTLEERDALRPLCGPKPA